MKSNKYTGVKYFKFTAKTFFKKSIFIVLKVDFNDTPDSNFETEYLNPILDCNYYSAYLDEDFDLKVEICLDMLSKHIFQWITDYFIFKTNFNSSASEFITKQHYKDNDIMSCAFSTTRGLPEKRIHLSYYNCPDRNLLFSTEELEDTESKYTGVKCFKIKDNSYFKNNAFISLEVNFNNENFEKDYLNTILKHAYETGLPRFKNFDEKAEHCLNIVSKWIFEWLRGRLVSNELCFKSPVTYISEKYNVHDILSDDTNKKKDIHLDYYEYDDEFIDISTNNIKIIGFNDV